MLHKIRHLGNPVWNRVFYRCLHLNRDWQPSSYPKTEEEKVAAAKKYNLLREEYEPIPDDGMGSGDYPDLPFHSNENNDPYYPWDYPEDKRNFGEPYHREFVNLGEDRINQDRKDYHSNRFKLLSSFGLIFGCWVIFKVFDCVKIFPPLKPKQYPKEGVVHYTFKK